MFLMQGESSHACNRTLYSACRTACDAHAHVAHTKTRLEATLPFRALEMQLQFSLQAGLLPCRTAKPETISKPMVLVGSSSSGPHMY